MTPARTSPSRLPLAVLAALAAALPAPLSGADPDPERWWSFRPLAPVIVPDLSSPWVRTPIDAFILARLREEGLEPSPEADRRTLIRRVTYDLRGLPPTPEEVDAFAADRSPDAYERLVDRLLSSPRYGERWARHWLDVVHYGETHGYDKDKLRPHAWPYRDYIIRAFNEDRPYARFIEEQIAGDVLYPLDRDGVIATGFIAAGPWDFVGHVELREGTVDKKITRSLDRDDMVMTALSTFASVTAHCARCHDHEFDPIPQEDYYRLQAVFAGIERAPRPYDPDELVHRRRRELERERRALEGRRDEIETVVRSLESPEISAIDRRLIDARRKLEGLAFDRSAEAGKRPSLGFHSKIMKAPDEVKWVEVDLGREVSLDHILLFPAHVAYGGHPGPGFGFPPRFRVEIARGDGTEPLETLADPTGADHPHPGNQPVVIDGAGRRARRVRVTATRLWKRTDDWIFALGELRVLSGGEDVTGGAEVRALDSIEAPPGWAGTNLVDGTAGLGPIADLGDLEDIARRARDRATLLGDIDALERERRAIARSLLEPDARAELARLADRLPRLEEELGSLPEPTLVYAAAARFPPQGNFTPPVAPRPVHVLHRGKVESPGRPARPGALSALPELEYHFEGIDVGDEGARRAALARWLSDPENPLTWRSIANRVWQYHMLRGIVETPNDFGRMGARPSHPGLLDWLAARLERRGGSLKALHRLIVTSSVYRQSSAHRGEAARIDAENRLLWRMNRRRLEAEAVRDAALAVAGALDLRMGGPSARLFAFEDDHSPRYDYAAFDFESPAGRRRSVYRLIVRSVPDPFLECLDCADPSILTPRRAQTITPLQALALLNDPFMTLQAERFAARLTRLAEDPAERVVTACRLAFGRTPEPVELEVLTRYAREHGLENLCRLILNASEFIFVD